MTGRTLPTVGNIVIVEHGDHVELRLRMEANGPQAVFTYEGLQALISTLQSVHRPEPEALSMADFS